MNLVVLEGRMVADPEVRYSAGENATAILNFNIAVNRDFKNSEGNYEADFIRCISFGKQSEFIAKYFHKGDPILITGNIRTGSYTKQDGTKAYTTDVYVDKVSFVVGGKGSTSTQEQADSRQPSSQQPAKARNNQPDMSFMNIPDGIDNDEMPF